MIVHFVDIGGIDDHHCLNFMFTIKYYTYPLENLPCQFGSVVKGHRNLTISISRPSVVGNCNLKVKLKTKVLCLA